MVHPLHLLRWLYLGRLMIAAGIFGGALLVWSSMDPAATRLISLILVFSISITLAGFWRTHLRRIEPGRTFLYTQILFDTLLVTAVVHLTGGSESDFATLYILVIAAAGVLLPLPGGVLIGALSSLLYIADIIWGQAISPPWTVFIQVVIFALVALATGLLGDALRKAGTALGEVESELRQLRLETDEILRALDTGILTIGEGGKLVYLNPAAERLLGISGESWIGQPIFDELEVRTPGLGALMEKTLRERDPTRWGEVTLIHSEDQRRTLGVRTTTLDRDGSQTRVWVTAVVQDITDGKRVEALNRRADRLQAVAELAASLAHEIRNPLASIRSAVEQLTGEVLPETEMVILQRLALNESDRLSRLLGEFVEFSRVRLQRWAGIDLTSLIGEIIELIDRHPESDPSIDLHLHPPERPLLVEGDADLLHRAIYNVVLNATQHAGPGGEVAIELDLASGEALPPGLQVESAARLRITDSGPGIPPDDRARLFDPFFTTRAGGTGLGLALVYRAIEAHRGMILIDEGPEGGARFVLYLPREAAAADEPLTPRLTEVEARERPYLYHL